MNAYLLGQQVPEVWNSSPLTSRSPPADRRRSPRQSATGSHRWFSATGASIYDFLWLIGEAIFFYLPVGICWSAVKKMGGTPNRLANQPQEVIDGFQRRVHLGQRLAVAHG
jgi:hypothetical protein